MRFAGWVPGTSLAAALVACGVVGACSSDAEPPVEPPGLEADAVPAEPALRRLLARQYVRSVAHLLGDAAAASAKPPADTQLNGFSAIAASQLSMNDSLVDAYESSARAVAASAVTDSARIAALAGCKSTASADEACLSSFVERFGRLAWRRPLSAEERDDLVALGKQGVLARGTFVGGVELVIAALLQAPSFLYQVELGVAPSTRNDIRVLTGYEMATRLSFLLLGRTPDSALLDAAGAGELDVAAGVRTWAEKLLETSESREALRGFFAELFVLDGIETLARDPELFPDFSPEVAESMREEALRIVDDVIARDAPFTEVLTTTRTFVDARLANHYGLSVEGDGWRAVELPDEQGRTGLLTSAAVMTKQAHGTSTSATYRGLFVMERFLCTTMPPPPPGVITTLPPSSAAPTLRERLEVHRSDPSCGACHYLSDNLGLTFERYDAVGRYRATENGAPIDPSGEVDQLGAWSGPRELAERLAASEGLHSCLLRQLHRYATGHVEVDGEWPALNELTKRWEARGGSFRPLLVDFASSELFRRVGAMTP
ncbi:MAG: DUF1592 domain-containing protein [Deltaproteobacteria bacterium]|nr:DUF1592 domain-containing protein [Deltaproteobacteria bacterium]